MLNSSKFQFFPQKSFPSQSRQVTRIQDSCVPPFCFLQDTRQVLNSLYTLCILKKIDHSCRCAVYKKHDKITMQLGLSYFRQNVCSFHFLCNEKTSDYSLYLTGVAGRRDSRKVLFYLKALNFLCEPITCFIFLLLLKSHFVQSINFCLFCTSCLSLYYF